MSLCLPIKDGQSFKLDDERTAYLVTVGMVPYAVDNGSDSGQLA